MGLRRRLAAALLTGFEISLFGLISPPRGLAQSLPWMNSALPPQQRAQFLVNAMTLDQKIEQLHGQPGPIPEVPSCGMGFRHIPGIASLQIPTFRITNGPVGIGQGDCSPSPSATALPSSLALAASFDRALAASYGDLLGREGLDVGIHEIEGPGMDLARIGQGGRNFEYLGEDPMLAGTLAASEIRAIQSHGLIAMSKHYVGNDQEANRATINDIIDDRTLHEIYLLPFEISINDGDVASVMCAYNRVNGPFNCENAPLLTGVLRDLWGFKGYVQSDFGAAHSTAPSLLAGMDLEMPSPTYYTPTAISVALDSGTITEAEIDRALLRRYTQMFRMGQFDRPIALASIDAAGDGAIARSIGEQSSVLLKNASGLLPLDPKGLHSIALIGQSAFASSALAGGGGSSLVTPLYTVAPLQGLQNVLQCLGSSANVTLFVAATDGSNDSAAAALAASADVAIVMAGVVTSEGTDRPNLSLPNNQDALISAVAGANSNTVVVLKDGDPVLMPWIDQVAAVLETWFPGEEDGNIAADLLFGVANPSGKLPVTYPRAAGDVPTNTPDRYPGVDVNGNPTVFYSEALDVGYRWYDSQNIQPLFPFGFGLSYTMFSYSNLQIATSLADGTAAIQVTFSLQNTGGRAGAEVPQVYLGLPASTGEPPKRLVAFDKVTLDPGEVRNVTFTIDPAASNHPLSYWDTASQGWVIADGDYKVYLGSSSRDIKETGSFSIHHSSCANDVTPEFSISPGWLPFQPCHQRFPRKHHAYK